MQANPILFLSFSSLCVKMRRVALKTTKTRWRCSILYRKSPHHLHLYTNVHNLFDFSKFIYCFLRDKCVFTIKVNLLLLLISSYTTTNQTR
jgi:hypothetical protein